MNSIFKRPHVEEKHGRNGFDVSRRRLFTAPCGMLLPTYIDYANPGDKYKCDTSAFIRTDALQSAAMMRLKAHAEWFFVPFEQLYHFWNEYYYNTQDIDTNFLGSPNSVEAKGFQFPYLNIYDSYNFGLDPNGGNSNWYILDTKYNESENTITYHLKCDEFGLPYAWHFRRLFDMLGYGSVNYVSESDSNIDTNFLPIPFLAYHRIFYSHYQNTMFFPNRYDFYNVDSYHGSVIPRELGRELVSKIHYRPWRKDFFTNMQPTPQFSASYANAVLGEGSIASTDTNVRFDVNQEGYSSQYVQSLLNMTGDARSGGTGATLFVQNGQHTQFNAGDIRALFAYDKLLRITASTGTHYDQQTLAHFGFNPPKGISKDVYFLGEQTTDISINEVVATSTTAEDPKTAKAGQVIGDIAGKGFGASTKGQNIGFTCPCHGVVMCLFSIEPIPDYASMGTEQQLRYYDAMDFYHPEFDNVGMVPLYDAFFNYSLVPISNSRRIYGWTYRYSELKTKFDVVNESIFLTGKSTWAGWKQYLYDSNSVNDTPTLNTLFYIAPQYTNSIFLADVDFYGFGDVSNQGAYFTVPVQVNGYFQLWESDFCDAPNVYAGDNFIVNLDHNVFKTSIMSVHSLPKI